MPTDSDLPPTLSVGKFDEAETRIRPYIRRTPLRSLAPGLWLKCEHEQYTGSFKLRGALNKVLQLDEAAWAGRVVCASAGNHGLGVATACRLVGLDCTVYVPQGAPSFKIELIQRAGAELVVVEGDYGQAEREGLRAATESQAAWISPYNDLDVILGQGTIGLELAHQFQEVGVGDSVVYVPASGGGLVCGLGMALRTLELKAEVVAVQTAAAPYLLAAHQGVDLDSVEERPTMADALAGPVEPGSVTLSLLRQAVDRVELVEEREIEAAIHWLAERGEMVEPSAAVGVAVALRESTTPTRVALITGASRAGRRAGLFHDGGSA